MKYYLSENDRKVLSQTINTVNNLSVNTRGKNRPTIKNVFAFARLTEEDENGLWSAVEVYFDETGTPNDLAGGRAWGGENLPSIIVNGTVSADSVIKIERHYYVDSNGQEQPTWVGSAVGGSQFAFAQLTTEDANGLWSAFEVYFDQNGTPNQLIGGRVWGTDLPAIIVNFEVSADTVVRVERYYYVDPQGEDQETWVASSLGGTSTLRLKCLSDTSINYNSTNTNFSLIDNSDNVLASNVSVVQRKFTTANFYENEILYAQLEDGTYDLSPFLAGIGGTSA